MRAKAQTTPPQPSPTDAGEGVGLPRCLELATISPLPCDSRGGLGWGYLSFSVRRNPHRNVFDADEDLLPSLHVGECWDGIKPSRDQVTLARWTKNGIAPDSCATQARMRRDIYGGIFAAETWLRTNFDASIRSAGTSSTLPACPPSWWWKLTADNMGMLPHTTLSGHDGWKRGGFVCCASGMMRC